MKERLQGIVVGLLIGTLSAGSVVYAKSGVEHIQISYDNIKVYKDNQLYNLKDSSGKTVEPFVYNGTTYLPLRSAANLAGMDVTWDSKTKSIHLWDEMSGPEKVAVDMMEVCQPNYTGGVCYVYTKYDGESFPLGDKYYVSGLKFVGDSGYAEFELNGKYSEMTMMVGHVPGSLRGTGVLTFTVDGKEVEEVKLGSDQRPKEITVPLKRGNQLRIDCNGDASFAQYGLGNIKVK